MDLSIGTTLGPIQSAGRSLISNELFEFISDFWYALHCILRWLLVRGQLPYLIPDHIGQSYPGTQDPGDTAASTVS